MVVQMLEITDIENKILQAKANSLVNPVNIFFNLNPGIKQASLTQTDRIAARILYILSNEEIFGRYLDELNEQLGVTELPARPVNYIQIHSTNLPAPPASAIQNGSLLQSRLKAALLKQEQKHNVNLGRKPNEICTFIGAVPESVAEELIGQGDLWEDYHWDITGLYHGRYSHRIQHYVILRAIEDNPVLFEGLGQSSPLKQILGPDARFKFVFPTRTRAYWNLVFENDRHVPDYYFIRRKNTITGPSMLMEYLLSERSFVKLPALAHAIHDSMCEPLFGLALKTSKTAFQVLCEYQKSSVQGRCSEAILDPYANHILQALSHLFTTRFCDGHAGATYLYKSIFRPSITKTVTVKNSPDADIESLCDQLRQMELAPHPNKALLS